jgi:nucleotide-binding universal stress UspA family protein
MEIRRILAPIDFSERSLEELRWATRMANIFGAELIILHVVPPETVEVYAREGHDWDSMRAGISLKARQMVEDAGREVGIAGLEHEEHIVEGNAIEEILHVINHRDIDFVVIATHGRTGISHTLMGSVVEKLVAISPVPMLTLSEASLAKAV